MRISVLPWLLLMFVFQPLICFRVYSQCLNDQRSLLLQFKNSLVAPASSAKLSTWDQNADCCVWLGVSCDPSGRVTGLELDHESIGGNLENSSSLFGLRYLERLNLAFNNFSRAEIPKGLRNLTNLSYLNLSNAAFGGQIPVELSEMSSLVVLDLSSIFQGISALRLDNPNLTMLVKNLTSLRGLYLDGVEVSSQEGGWAQAQSSFPPGLRNLSMRACGLSGPFEGSLSRLTSLSVLRLDSNNLSAAVPEYFADFANLTTLTLSFCNLQGTFPSKIFQIPTLENIDLTTNGLLGGTIPEFPEKGSLRTLVLSNTNFSGVLPDSIRNLSMLKEIDLSSCNFSGQIPPAIGDMTELARLQLSSNSFNDSIPLFLKSKNLKFIDLSRNRLTGSLSSQHFEGLSNLTYIDLGYNSFDGKIPPSLFGLPQLQKLMLSNNNFSGQVDVLPTLSSLPLDTIDLSSNQLEGPIPESFFQIRGLNVLSLSYNKFNGPVELEKFYMWSNLTRLELAYNNLSVGVANTLPTTAPLPPLSKLSLASCNLISFPDLRNLSKLTLLDLSDNNIKGEIPSWIWEIGNGGLLNLNLSFNRLEDFQKPYIIPSSLAVIDLHANGLQGEFPIPRKTSAIYIDYSSNYFRNPIPQDIGASITSVIFFSIANNSINGTIPPSLCNATYLQVLDLSINDLTGDIPACLLQNSKNIGVLNLGRNNIGGRIPDIFPADCGLKTLDLSSNNLWGSMPASLANCSSLEVLNVGNNVIEDGFPCMLTNLSSLRVLVLRSNGFHGGIICEGFKGNWTNLQIIDIASNKFDGSISPSCIASWTGMAIENGEEKQQNHLGFNFMSFNNLYYRDMVTVTMKGLELELVKILTVFTSIDISGNNFDGTIPEAIGDLSSLYVLNLSHNALAGPIPKSIGKLKQLGSLDLSSNQLTGEIPQELAGLTFLSVLNLAYNKLFGMIPTGTQFQSFPPTSYEENAGLCGPPLNDSCNSNDSAANSVIFRNMEFNWQFIIAGLGYGVGAALLLAPILFCKQWRQRCDKQMDRCLKLIFPGYGFSYVRYDGKADTMEKIEDYTTDEDEDDEDYDDEDILEKLSRGSYCVFCSKLDGQIKKALHNPKCTCHYLPPPAFSFFSTSTSRTDSLQVLYQ